MQIKKVFFNIQEQLIESCFEVGGGGSHKQKGHCLKPVGDVQSKDRTQPGHTDNR